MECVYMYQKNREAFGRQCDFEDVPATLLNGIESTSPEREVTRTGRSTITWDPTLPVSHSTMCTEPVKRRNVACVHSEGAWPAAIDAEDSGATNRFRKRREKGTPSQAKLAPGEQPVEPLANAAKRLGGLVQSAIKQNSTVNIYEEYYEGRVEDLSAVPASASGMAVLRDPCDTMTRTVTCLDWYMEGATRVATAYAVRKFQDRRLSKGMPRTSYIWDVSKPNSPETSIEPSSPLLSLRFNPKNPQTLIGGSYNGLVTFYDRRKRTSGPCSSSVIETSHHDPVTDVRWCGKKGMLCCSASTDGHMLWWDVRRMAEPCDSILLQDPASNTGKLYGASSMGFDFDTAPNKFLIGTEQGRVATVNPRARNSKVSMTTTGPGKHHGPIYAIERNPAHPKFYLTIGDWTARIWSEELGNPIMQSRYHKTYLTGACWSPSRPSVLLVTRKDGVLDVWDYFARQNEVVLTYKVSNAPLSAIAASRGHNMPQLVAVGDETGKVSLVQLSDSLTVMQQNEKPAIGSMFQREMMREKNLLAMEKQHRRELKKQQAAASKPADQKATEEGKAAEEEAELLEIEKNFLKLIQ